MKLATIPGSLFLEKCPDVGNNRVAISNLRLIFRYCV